MLECDKGTYHNNKSEDEDNQNRKYLQMASKVVWLAIWAEAREVTHPSQIDFSHGSPRLPKPSTRET